MAPRALQSERADWARTGLRRQLCVRLHIATHIIAECSQMTARSPGMEAQHSHEAWLTQCTGGGQARLLLQLSASSSNEQPWRFQRAESSARQRRWRQLRNRLPGASALASHQQEAPGVHCNVSCARETRKTGPSRVDDLSSAFVMLPATERRRGQRLQLHGKRQGAAACSSRVAV